jgi:class 3 adenylate cyclase
MRTVGPCLAVTLNERLDYFGRTVKRAARMQGLAAENEIYLSDEIHRLASAADVLAALRCDAQTVHVKGIEREIAVHAVRARH